MKKHILIGTIGIWPLWAAFVFIMYLWSQSRDSLVAVPWILLLAIPNSAITLLIIFVTFAIYNKTKGEASRKYSVAGSSFAAMTFLLISFWAFRQIYFYSLRHNMEREKNLAIEYVKTNKQLVLEIGPVISASLDNYKVNNNSMPIEYDLFVTGYKTVHAIIEVQRSSSETIFSLKCTTSLPVSARDPSKNVCDQ